MTTVTTVEKTFTFGGISNLNGVYKVRFANKADRVKVLQHNGHTDIRLFALDCAMTKYDAVMAIKDYTELEDIDAQQAFDDFFSKYTVVTPRVEVNYADAADILEAELAMV